MIFLLVLFLSASLAILGSCLQDPLLLYLFKPLSTALLLLRVLLPLLPISQRRRLLAFGLSCSLLGDVFLMLSGDYFLAGLLAFLGAHLAYILAFSTDIRFAARWTPFFAWSGVALLVVSWLWPAIAEGMHVPVLVYVAALVAMTAQASVRYLTRRDVTSGCVALGAVLFLISDTILASNRFRGPVPMAQPLILATYYLAQLLIIQSRDD